jgi:ribonuclease HI
MFERAKQITSVPILWKPRCTPGLIKEAIHLANLDIKFFPPQPALPSCYKYPPPYNPPICKTIWFPLNKKQASECRARTANTFNSLILLIPNNSIKAFADGSKTTTTNNTAFAVYIPELEYELTETLTEGTSIFSAEVYAIYQTLKFIYQMEVHPPGVTVFSDFSTAIKTIASNTHTDNDTVATHRELIARLKSSGTLTTLARIPSHTGIEGNETADRLASNECANPSGNQATIQLSPSEEISTVKPNWAGCLLQSLKCCQKKCVTTKSRIGIIK